jgi:uncharacterized protein (TIGR03437 family)
VNLAAAQPAIHTKDNSGSGQGRILSANGALFEPGNAAAAGDALVILCTGLGEVNPKVEAGKETPASPVSRVAGQVMLTIGGVRAQVSEAVLLPGSVGQYQVKATMPAGVEAGDSVAVVLSVAGQSSPAVTMAVR